MQTVDEQPRIDALRGVLSSVRFLSPLGHAPWHEVLALVQASETGMPVLDLGERCRVEVNEFAHVEVQRHPGGVIGVEWRLNGAGIAVIVAGCFLGGLPAIIAVLAFARTTKPVVQRLQVLLSGQMQDPGHHAQHVHVLETPPLSTPHSPDTNDMIEVLGVMSPRGISKRRPKHSRRRGSSPNPLGFDEHTWNRILRSKSVASATPSCMIRS